MKRILCVSVFAVLTLPAGALDNTVHNSFWDTRSYINPEPSIGRSAGSATAVDLSGRSWRVAEQLPKEFKSKRFVAFKLIVR